MEAKKDKTLTKGNIIVEDIKVGDVHYEFDWGVCCKTEVISLPKKDKDGIWTWQSKSVNTGRIIDYAVNPEFPSHYAVNLYNYEAYKGCVQI